MLALYLTDRATALKPSTLTRRMSAISVVHQEAGHLSPAHDPRVRTILSGIRRTHGTAPDQAKPATIGDIRQMVAHLSDTTIGIRDRALLLVGFTGAFRRSELVALNVGDLDEREEGYAITIRRSKNDQEAKGRRIALPFGSDHHTCPVSALRSWLDHAQLERGAVFRSIDRHGNIASRLSDRGVALVIKRTAERAGLDPEGFSGHSLRAGFATTAAANGASERQIAHQTGHRSMDVLRGYVRHGGVFIDNAASMVGL